MKMLLGIGATLALVLAACGGGGDGEGGVDPTDNSNRDRVQAVTMLLERADFAGEWTHSRTTSQYEVDPFDVCETADPASVIARAETGDFSNDQISAISEHLMIFEDEASAAAGIDRMDDRATCVVDVLESSGADTSTATFSDAAIEGLDTLPFGDGHASFRVTALGKTRNTGALIPEGTIYADFVYVVIGRVGIVILASNTYEPYDTATLEDVTAMAVYKIADELGLSVEDPRDSRPEPTTDNRSDAGTPTLAPGATLAGPGARSNPVPRGEIGTLAGRMSVRVVDVNFDAETLVLAENQFNDPAEDGKLMVLVTIEATNVGSNELDVFFDPLYFIAGTDGREYQPFGPSCGVIPDELEGELTPGESRTGNVCMQVDEDDPDLALAIVLFGELDEETVYFGLN